ncbi:hypothetical protein Pmani_031322 [Petrolisthes manimaculis]|uniref:G-protein coupled receptors family 2 profile 2 domain-containing protein n=1 Tax=Petrolisthes manimaculis TaxID=1843537 RepID=A0AAE1NVY2_9EUCA|nr:hypothetical protein Pmani_031322 [Petrolisthes manimaculis]
MALSRFLTSVCVCVLVWITLFDGTDAKSTSEDQVLPLCCKLNEFVNSSFVCDEGKKGVIADPVFYPGAVFGYNGFPTCENGTSGIVSLNLSDAFFYDRKMYLPTHKHTVNPIDSSWYCLGMTHVESSNELQTKVYVCEEKLFKNILPLWPIVGVAHFLIVLTLICFLAVPVLRRLQGQYMFYFLVCMLLHNILRFPGSTLLFEHTKHSCLIFGLLRCFLFICMWIWVSVICVEVLVALIRQKDVSSWRRFFLWSLFGWGMGVTAPGVLATVLYFTGRMQVSPTMILENSDVNEVNTVSCNLLKHIDWILLLMSFAFFVMDGIILFVATLRMCTYPLFGQGLLRTEASLCISQGWKLVIVLLMNALIILYPHYIYIELDSHVAMLLQSAIIFLVFAYWNVVLATVGNAWHCVLPCTRRDLPTREQEPVQQHQVEEQVNQQAEQPEQKRGIQISDTFEVEFS